MVEIEHPNVDFAAVDTRMCEEILANHFDRESPLHGLASHDDAHVGFAVAGIVIASLQSIARLAEWCVPVSR